MTGEKLFNLGVTRNGCKYVLGALVPKDDANYKGAFDCAEFASWLVYQTGKILYGTDRHDVKFAKKADAYTGFWGDDARKYGKIISVEEAIRTKGAFLLRLGGNGLIGHIVCSDGFGGTVEANSSKYGCGQFSTKNRRFDMGILIPNFSYLPTNKGIDLSDQKPKGIVYRWIKGKEFRGDVVKRIQQALCERGYLIPKHVTGFFGEITMNAVSTFQKVNGLTVDGEVYTATAKALGITL